MQRDSVPAEPQGKPKKTGVGSQSLLQQIFLTQESNCGFLHCRQNLFQLSYQGSPRNSQFTGVGSLSLLQGTCPPRSPTLQRDSLPAEPQGKPKEDLGIVKYPFIEIEPVCLLQIHKYVFFPIDTQKEYIVKHLDFAKLTTEKWYPV